MAQGAPRPAKRLCPRRTTRPCLFEAFVGRAARRRPRPRYQRREAAAGAGGASLGRRPRHVLDTGLSGPEPPHKGPGRRRNKGLFHAATEKPQIRSRVLRRRGGAAAVPRALGRAGSARGPAAPARPPPASPSGSPRPPGPGPAPNPAPRRRTPPASFSGLRGGTGCPPRDDSCPPFSERSFAPLSPHPCRPPPSQAPC